MEEKQGSDHQLILQGRKKGCLSGVVNVVSFDSEQIFLETTQGMLTIKGKELHVSRLHLEQGEVDVEGLVESLVYTENGPYGKKQKGSLVKRLFD
ncbi:MAG: sporulation protein YabP [Clostridia bacterium]|nr:sporulation protein YabP [Clostridia bacterium]NCC43746.1 sporulation protein YabP [Clostridia bacterium]